MEALAGLALLCTWICSYIASFPEEEVAAIPGSAMLVPKTSVGGHWRMMMRYDYDEVTQGLARNVTDWNMGHPKERSIEK